MQHYNKSILFFLSTYFLWAQGDVTGEIERLKQRLSVLEGKQPVSKGVINLSSTETTMILGGRVTLDTIYLSSASGEGGGSNSSDQFFNANNIPLQHQGEEDELSLTARNSRFWIKTRTLSDEGKPFLTLLEIDFWGSSGNEQNSNSHNPRLRHAYFTYNGWTIGQTNSLFVSSIKPLTLMLPVDDVFMRQPIISYERDVLGAKLAFSLEQPESVIMTKEGVKVRVNDDTLPDIGIKYHAHHGWGEYTLSLIARQLSVNHEIEQSAHNKVFGYGLNFNAKIDTFSQDSITWGMVGGKGIGRYLATSFFPGAAITEENRLEAQSAWGGHVSYEHWIDTNLQFNTAWGYVATNPILQIETIDMSAYSMHVAMRYSPVNHLLLSSEFIYAKRILQNDYSADVNRIYFQASYNF